MQANISCTVSRTRKNIIGLAVAALILGSAFQFSEHYADHHPIMDTILSVLYIALYVVLPVAVLGINIMLIREVRRASANNLALQQQRYHQSQHSAVPTAMLITTSVIYLLLTGPHAILELANHWTPSLSLQRGYEVAHALSYLVFAYNFYVYLIISKRFRSELHAVFRRCCSFFSSSFSSSSSASRVTACNRNAVGLRPGRGETESDV